MTESEKGTYRDPTTVDVTAIYGNVTQEIVRIPLDRLSLILHRHAGNIGRRREWIAPFGILLTIAIVLATSDFKQYILSAATWEALFVLVLVADVLWFVASVVRALRTPKIEDLVERIKNN